MNQWPAPNRIYFVKPIGMDGPIKIGASSVPESRLKELLVWSPFPLEIMTTCPGSYALEKNLHDCFFEAHAHHEWFHPCPELLAGIERLKAGEAVTAAFDLTARKGSIWRRQRGRIAA